MDHLPVINQLQERYGSIPAPLDEPRLLKRCSNRYLSSKRSSSQYLEVIVMLAIRDGGARTRRLYTVPINFEIIINWSGINRTLTRLCLVLCYSVVVIVHKFSRNNSSTPSAPCIHLSARLVSQNKPSRAKRKLELH